MNDIVTHEEQSREISGGLSDAQTRLALLRETLTNPDVQPGAAREMAELMFRLEDRDRETRFREAKVAAIAEMPRISKDGRGNHDIPYAKWESMQPIINRILSKYGLALSFDVGSADNGDVKVTPKLEGHGWIERGDSMQAKPDKGPGRNDIQAVASAKSYLMRHSGMAFLNIVQGGISEDDDGNAGGGTPIDAYAQLDPEMRAVVDGARSAAGEGIAAYEAHFKSLPPNHRGFLNFNQAWPHPETWHQQNKELAAKIG